MSYITTYTGKYFDPTNPEIEKIDVRDFAHALSLICRGNGQVQKFFSVGQHCINCCMEAKERGYSKRVIFACLLHDASESYMSDVPRPFKKTLTSYIEQEQVLLDMIYTKYLGSPLTSEEERQVKEVDDAMLWYDLTYLLNDKPDCEAPKIHITLEYDRFVPFEEVESKYLKLFEELK